MSSPRRLAMVAALALGAFVVLGAGSARAQDAAAEVLFRDGDRLMGEGKLVEACAAFEASNRVEPRAGTLIRLGNCREKSRQLASAWSAYVDAVARAKDPDKRDVASRKVHALEPRLSKLTVTVDDPVAGLAITRGDEAVDGALWGRPVPIDGGSYTIHASAAGFEPWTTTITVPVEQGDVTVEVPALRALPRVVAPIVTGDPDAPHARDTDRARGWSGRRKAAVGFAATGLVIGGVAIALGVQARAMEADAHTICPDPICTRYDEANATLGRARTRATLANVGYGVGGAALATAAILWLTGGAPAGPHHVAIVPAGAGAAVMGRF